LEKPVSLQNIHPAMKNTTYVHFLGAAGTVTGSKYLIETAEKKILIDCGLFQGLKELRLLNWNYFPVDVKTIDYVILTHGHLDHVGFLPCIIKAGFKGKIYASEPTLEIAEIILKDSAKIQEEEAARANKYGYSKHKIAKPLYELKDVEETIIHFSPLKSDEWIDMDNDIRVRLQSNGHIIGSTFIELDINEKRFVFSGDVGQEKDLLMNKSKKPVEADILFMESTYGDRLHVHEDLKARLKKIIMSAIAKGGTILIPSFAVERTQTLMYLLWQLRKENEIPEMPMIMDSPMGANVLKLFHRFYKWHKLPMDECDAMCKMFWVVEDFKETQTIISNEFPKIVIAGSGMITGGRMLSYLQHYLEKPETTIILAGYQAEGTRGRKLLEGVHELKIYGKYYKVKAHTENITGLSAHGDQQELLNWMSDLKKAPEKLFLVHGEKQAIDTFKVKIKDVYGWDAIVPVLYQIVEV
jgi:metallo-beta-lactamase family protein